MTRLIAYLRHRRTFTRRTSWRLAVPSTAGDVAILTAMMLIVVFLIGDSLARIVEADRHAAVTHAEQRSAAEITKLERVIASCLSGAVVINGVAHECQIKSLGVRP